MSNDTIVDIKEARKQNEKECQKSCNKVERILEEGEGIPLEDEEGELLEFVRRVRKDIRAKAKAHIQQISEATYD